MSRIEVVGLGALNIDHICKVERILVDGETIVEESKSFPGGSAANTIYGLAKLGVNTSFSGVVGDDAEGRILTLDFEKVGVDVSQVKVKPNVKTGLVWCLSDKLGKRSLYVLPGANNLLTTDDLDMSYINQVKMLHLSSFADERQFKVLLEVIGRLDLSVKVSFAPGILHATKGFEALIPILARTYVLFVNQSEIRELTRLDVITGAERCLRQGCHIVAVTMGKGTGLDIGKGANRRTVKAVGYIRDTEGEYAIEPGSPKIVPEVDTIGAGDAFATGFLYGLLKGKGLEECGRLGDMVARFSIAKLGARDGLPTLNELTNHYQELYGQRL